MTDPLYLDEPYDRTFEATVARTAGERVVLDRTCFYPAGGGQPADRGTLAAGERTWRVADVEKTDTIYHRLVPIEKAETDDRDQGNGDGAEPENGSDDARTAELPVPEPGTTVTGGIDWDRRYAHMRYHTAQHLLSALLLAEYNAPTTGNRLYADRARLDVAYDRFEGSDLDAIEAAMNDLVSESRSVTSYEMSRETAEAELDPERTRLSLLPDSITEVRIVEIAGYDRTACAGTHVGNTEEIGAVTITGRETRGVEGERLRFVLDA